MNTDQFTALQLQVTTIETIVKRMDKEILGNGQPGSLQLLTDRVSDAESSISFYRGAVWIIGTLLSLLGGAEIIHLVKVGV